MTCKLWRKCTQCNGKLVAHGHQARYPPAIGRPLLLAKRNGRDICMETNASSVRECVTGPLQTIPRPLQGMPRGTSSAQLPLRHTEVEVHLSVCYKCDFGSKVAVIGSQQGWQTTAAAPMSWSPGDMWSTVITLPVGSDVEYKYIVISDSGTVVRWQEGGNNKLALRNPGYLLHVTDTWAQDRRQVHEIGLPAAAAVPTATMTSSGRSTSQQSNTPGTAARNGGGSSSSSSVRLQNNIARFSRLAPGRHATATTTPASTSTATPSGPLVKMQEQAREEKPIPNPQPPQQQKAPQQQSTASMKQSFAPAQSGSTHTHDTGSSVTSSSNKLPALLQQEQQLVTVPSHLAVDIDELLPLLQNELSSALDALSSCSTAQEASSSELLADGRAVLNVLQRQLSVSRQTACTAAVATSAADEQNNSSSILQPVVAVAESSTAAAHPQHTAASQPADVTAAPSMSSSATTSTATMSSSNSSRGRRSSSAWATLSSEDEIAAALLSDDCEEACYCLVDAICSCMGSEAAMEELCEVPYEDSEVHSDIHQTQTAAVTEPTVAVVAEAATSSSAPRQGTSAVQSMAAEAEDDQPITAEQLALHSARSTAAAAPEVDAATRAAAFAGVQRALEHSAELLESLSDPTHPMMLAADREVAVARHQLGLLLPA